MKLLEILGRWLGTYEVVLPAPPPSGDCERMGLPEEMVQLVYLDGLGWVYQLRPDQRDAFRKELEQRKKEQDAQTYANPDPF